MSGVARKNFDLSAALGELERACLARNPRSRARHEAACRALPGGNTRSVLHYAPLPLAMARGEGCYLWDLDGHRYVDFLCEYSAGLYGHSHPLIAAAVERALADGIVLGAPNLYEGPLAEALSARFPSLGRVRFCNSGSEANLMALGAARAITGRSKVLAFREAYHGGFLMLAGGGAPLNVPIPIVLGEYNDAEGTLALIERERADLAAVIVEPMLAAGGCIPAERGFLEALRAATERHGIVLVFDEVVTSRLAPAGLQGELGVVPDMTTLGKYVGGGLPAGAFGGRESIMARFDPGRPDAFFHAGTFNNNVLTMAAGLAGLTQIYTAEAAETLNARGERLRERLNALLGARGAPCLVTGRGSVMNLHFVGEAAAGGVRTPRDLEPRRPDLQRLLHLALLERGHYLAARGLIALSLPMSEKEMDGLCEAVEGVLNEYSSVVGS